MEICKGYFGVDMISTFGNMALYNTLDALGNENNTFTLEFVKSRLLQEEQRMKMRMEATNVKSEASALVSSHPDSPAVASQVQALQ